MERGWSDDVALVHDEESTFQPRPENSKEVLDWRLSWCGSKRVTLVTPGIRCRSRRALDERLILKFALFNAFTHFEQFRRKRISSTDVFRPLNRNNSRN
jgi:hypothetical protein